MRDVTDGTSNTVAAGELALDVGGWARGAFPRLPRETFCLARKRPLTRRRYDGEMKGTNSISRWPASCLAWAGNFAKLLSWFDTRRTPAHP